MYMPHDVLRRRPRRRKRFRGLEAGQGLIEYALILSLVAVVVIIILSAVGHSVSNVFQNITCNLDTQTDCGSTVAMAPPDTSGGSGSGTSSGTGSGTGTGAGTGTGSGSGTGTGSGTGSGSGTGTGSGSGTGTGSGTGASTGTGSGSGSGVPTTNQPPSMDSINPQTVNEGQSITIPFNADDPEGDPLVYSVVGLDSSFMTFTDNGDGTAALVVVPDYNNAGSYTVNVSVGDGLSAPDAQNIDITIPNVVHDTDADTIEDEVDNCPATSNTSQDDWDEDGAGDVCDGHYYLSFGSSSDLLDSDGNTWKASNATSTGGTIYSVMPTSITGITDPDVCKNLAESRSGSTGKDLNVNFSGLPSGDYVLNLYFAETRSSNQGKFDILVEGTKKVNNYQPKNAGFKVAHKVTTSLETVSDGTLTLKLDRSSGIPSLCAMEIVKQ